MNNYIINVTEIEELQMIRNTDDLDRIFEKAKVLLVGGGTVELVRKKANGSQEKFDEITSLTEFETYKNWVYKYL